MFQFCDWRMGILTTKEIFRTRGIWLTFPVKIHSFLKWVLFSVAHFRCFSTNQLSFVVRCTLPLFMRLYIYISKRILSSSKVCSAAMHSIELTLTSTDLYGLSAGISGLAFLPSENPPPSPNFDTNTNYFSVLPGSIMAFLVFFLYSSHHSKALKSGRSWAKLEEYRRLPLSCIDAPAFPIALFWLGWSSRLSIHPVMPMMSGVFFGFGYLLIFIALINYLTL